MKSFLSGGLRDNSVRVTGIWLRAANPAGTAVEVLAEVGGEWRLLQTERCDGPFSVIIEPGKIADAPRDTRSLEHGQQLAERG